MRTPFGAQLEEYTSTFLHELQEYSSVLHELREYRSVLHELQSNRFQFHNCRVISLPAAVLPKSLRYTCGRTVRLFPGV